MSVYDSFDEKKRFACRVIADHARATAFAIADGILPANEGRNYVLRKIMRRAIYQGRHTLGFERLFFHKVTNFVVDQMGEAYPELEVHREFIDKMVRLEEERFGSTLTVGLQKIDELLVRLKAFLSDWKERSTIIDRALHTLFEAAQKPGYDKASVDAEIAEMFRVYHKKFPGAISHEYEGLAMLVSQHGSPPFLVEGVFRHNGFLVEGEPFDRRRLAVALYVLFKGRGNAAASAIANSIDRDYGNDESKYDALLSRLNMTFSGVEDKIPNFKDFAYLYDTFGTPRDLIYVALNAAGFAIDEQEFEEFFNAAIRELHQPTAAERGAARAKAKPAYADVAGRVQSLFRGYETTRVDDAKVLALIRDDEEVHELREGDEGEVILDQTPFYAESGGQVGDVGSLVSSGTGVSPVEHAQDARATAIARVADTYSPVQGLIIHEVRIEKSTLKVGDTVTAEVDVEKRDATRRNHTATHLVHAALREVLGGHVKQAGSVVAPNYLRFDFNHYQPMTEDEIKEVERLVNEQILRNVKVDTEIMPVEDAIHAGAMALFGEKYSGMMRVLTVPGFSKELCGGTHVRATGDIGVFKITSDESIASGVRRIRAITGVDAYERFREDEEIIGQVTSDLRTSRAELSAMIGKLQEELKKARREADELRLKIATGAVGSAPANGDDARDVAGVRVLAREASGLDAAGMRQLSDTLLARLKSGVVVVGRSNDGKASLIVRTSDDLTAKVPAGKVIKELAPIIGGKGGGKPDMAEGGGTQPEKLTEALEASYSVIERLLTQGTA